MSDQATPKRGLFRLIADVPALIVQLFRDELESLKIELANKVKGIAVGAVLIGIAVTFVLLAVVMLLIAAVFALALVLPTWAAALIVAAGLLVIAGAFVAIGVTQFKRGDVGKTARSVRKDVEAIKGTGKRD